MRLRPLIAALAALALAALCPAAAFAWDDLGHEVIVRIAWSTLTPAVRERVVEILAAAPADAGIASLRPDADDPMRDVMFAAYASIWPDLVRRREPAERHAYHRGDRHYVNLFWSQAADGTIVPVTSIAGDSLNILVALERQSAILRNAHAAPGDRAVALAWVLHLVGDIHQPLHVSDRVTAEEPTGDKGGNTFLLDKPTSLHWYWDKVLSARYPRREGETPDAYVERVATEVLAHTSRDSLATRIAEPSFDLWAQESLRAAEHDVYCCGVERAQEPPDSYLVHADAIAEPAVALAGYRLAALLERLLAP